jgi:hypothetical protein
LHRQSVSGHKVQGAGGRRNCGKAGGWNALKCWRGTLSRFHAMSTLGIEGATNHEKVKVGSGFGMYSSEWDEKAELMVPP